MARLTPRERKVLTFLAEGSLNKQVACERGIGENTIEVHLASRDAKDRSALADIGPRSNIGTPQTVIGSFQRRITSGAELPVLGIFAMSQVEPFVAVIDDDESVSRAIKRLLRAAGMAADTFRTGDDFLDMFDSIPSYRPACIVLDVQMPGLNGLEVQRRLAGSGIPIVFITAHDEVAVREQALAAGAAGYLRKPFNDEILIKAVRSAVDLAAKP
jgi:FixJ family two-component response regulator